MLKKILLLAAALVAVLAAPAAAQYETDVLSGEVSNPTPAPGETFTVSGTCLLADEVTVALDDVLEVTIPVVDDQYSGPVTIPSDLAPGTYDLTITCGTEVLTLAITVPGGTGSGPLARTGSDSTGTLLKGGGALLLVGAGAVLLATKRRRALA